MPLIILDIGAKFTAIAKVLERATAVEPFKLPDHINIDVPPGANNNHQNILLNQIVDNIKGIYNLRYRS